MPSVYLSPSLQEYNPYIDGGNEEYYMNLIADAMEPYLRASGIDFRRNDPDMTLSQAIADSNKGNHDLHLAIHSNAAPEGSAGRYTGADIYYYPTGSNGKRFAEILQKNYKRYSTVNYKPFNGVIRLFGCNINNSGGYKRNYPCGGGFYEKHKRRH